MKSALADFQTLPLKDAARQLPAQRGYQSACILAKINYRIHTDAIKETLIPPAITPMRTLLSAIPIKRLK